MKHSLLCVMMLTAFVCRSPAFAQWVKTTGPDSVHVLVWIGSIGFENDVSSSTILAGHRGGVSFSQDKGSSWHLSNIGLNGTLDVRAAVDLPMYPSAVIGLQGGDIRRSESIESPMQVGWSVAGGGTLPATVTALLVQGTVLYAGTSDSGVFVSSGNGSDNWLPRNTGLANRQVRALARRGDTLFAGATQGVFRSVNDGVEWSPAGHPTLGYSVHAFSVLGAHVFAASDSGVHRSTDAGATWILVRDGLPAAGVTALAVQGPNLYAATDSGVYRSTDSGENWHVFGSEMGVGRVHALLATGSVGAASSRLFAARDDGVWARPFADSVVALRPSVARPAVFRLDGMRSVSFTLSTPTHVRLTVHDLNGVHRGTPISETFSAGTHVRQLRPATVQSGTMIYRFEAGGQVETRIIPVGL